MNGDKVFLGNENENFSKSIHSPRLTSFPCFTQMTRGQRVTSRRLLSYRIEFSEHCQDPTILLIGWNGEVERRKRQ